jgi:DNA-directed RNA polymerase specialized sigma24 family protein
VEAGEALEQFAEADEEAARAAYAWLCGASRSFLHACLKPWLSVPQDREDVVQETYGKIWQMRGRFRNQGVAAWYALLKRTAANCRVDLVRARGSAISLQDLTEEDIPDADLPALDEILFAASTAIEAGELYHLANILWLGLDPALSAETHTRQLLAAQLYYLDGEPWENVLRLVGPSRAAEPPLSRETLDTWLGDPGVIRFVAYGQLHYPNDRLAAHLLGLPELVGPHELDTLMRQTAGASPSDAGPGGWTQGETAVILWRYRHALLLEQILTRRDCPLAREEVIDLLERSGARFPFSRQMINLLARLSQRPGSKPQRLLGRPGLWQRLAFQYRYANDLPHRDIQERIEPASTQVHYVLTPGMLNVWLSGGRLLKQLALFCAEARGSP